MGQADLCYERFRRWQADGTWQRLLAHAQTKSDAVGEVDWEVVPQLQPATTLRPAGWGRRRVYRADFSDQHSLTRDLGVPVRTYFGLDSRLATGALAALTWVPGASSAPRGLHLPGSDRWLAMARGRHGTSRWASGRVQSHATAMLAGSHPASTTCTGY